MQDSDFFQVCGYSLPFKCGYSCGYFPDVVTSSGLVRSFIYFFEAILQLGEVSLHHDVVISTDVTVQ